jgi:hypothetical protein
MFVNTELQYSVPMVVAPSLEDHLEIARLLAAAVVNPVFCRLLLEDPKLAIDNGYQGETFILSDAARFLLLYIHADTLADLARQITRALGTSTPFTNCGEMAYASGMADDHFIGRRPAGSPGRWFGAAYS